MNFAYSSTRWVLLGVALVFFMQAGFHGRIGVYEGKNTGSIIMKSLSNFACGSLVFWTLGYGLLFGDPMRFSSAGSDCSSGAAFIRGISRYGRTWRCI
jgi:ammonia channel protein AmtB